MHEELFVEVAMAARPSWHFGPFQVRSYAHRNIFPEKTDISGAERKDEQS